VLWKYLFTWCLLLLVTTGAAGQAINPTSVQTLGTGPNTAKLSFDGNTNTGWFPGWNPANYPAKAVVDLGAIYKLTKIRLYDGPGQPNLTFAVATSAVADTVAAPFATIPCDLYMSWKEQSVNAQGRFIVVTIPDIQGQNVVPEIELHGTLVGPGGGGPGGPGGPGSGDTTVIYPNPPTAVIGNLSGAATQFGMNGFDWIPFDMQPFGRLRVYQYLSWMWTGPNGKIKVAPSARGDVDYDEWLLKAKQNGVWPVFCPNKVPGWLVGQDPNNWGEWMDGRLHAPNVDGTQPAHYLEAAKFYWQIAARWGNTMHPDNLLNVDQTQAWPNQPINQPKSGLGLLKYLEIENEPDRPWKSPEFKYTPQQYAALLSAAYDGHCNTMGPGVGIKNADPSMIVVAGGLSAMDLAYLQAMLDWCVANRADHKFPADIINVHHYALSNNPAFPGNSSINLWESKGISPEADKVKARLQGVVIWAANKVPNAEVWYTEFGYDTKPPSTPLATYPQLYGGHTAEELQKIWLARTYLDAIAAGIDVAMMYNGIDENSAASGWVYGSSGLASGQYPQDGTPPFQKKPSWHFLKWLVSELNGHVHVQDATVGDLRVYAFQKGDSTKYVYWSATAADVTAAGSIQGYPVLFTETPQILKMYHPLPTASVGRDIDLKGSVRLYPNPVTDYVIVEALDAVDLTWVRILDGSGRILQEHQVNGQTIHLPLTGLPAGMYLCLVETGDGHRFTHKIIKL
jgi:hypothetical protein